MCGVSKCQTGQRWPIRAQSLCSFLKRISDLTLTHIVRVRPTAFWPPHNPPPPPEILSDHFLIQVKLINTIVKWYSGQAGKWCQTQTDEKKSFKASAVSSVEIFEKENKNLEDWRLKSAPPPGVPGGGQFRIFETFLLQLGGTAAIGWPEIVKISSPL